MLEKNDETKKQCFRRGGFVAVTCAYGSVVVKIGLRFLGTAGRFLLSFVELWISRLVLGIVVLLRLWAVIVMTCGADAVTSD